MLSKRIIKVVAVVIIQMFLFMDFAWAADCLSPSLNFSGTQFSSHYNIISEAIKIFEELEGAQEQFVIKSGDNYFYVYNPNNASKTLLTNAEVIINNEDVAVALLGDFKYQKTEKKLVEPVKNVNIITDLYSVQQWRSIFEMIIHGVGPNKPGYSRDYIPHVKRWFRLLFKQITGVEPPAEAVYFFEAVYADVVTSRVNPMVKKYNKEEERYGVREIELTQKAIGNFAATPYAYMDAGVREEMYKKLDAVLAEIVEIALAQGATGDWPTALNAIMHSQGTVTGTEWIQDRLEKGMWPDVLQTDKIILIGGVLWLKSILRSRPLSDPLRVQKFGGMIVNIKDPQDAIGRFLRLLSPEFADAIFADGYLNVGSFLNPLSHTIASHTKYWNSRRIAKIKAMMLVFSALRQNPAWLTKYGRKSLDINAAETEFRRDLLKLLRSDLSSLPQHDPELIGPGYKFVSNDENEATGGIFVLNEAAEKIGFYADNKTVAANNDIIEPIKAKVKFTKNLTAKVEELNKITPDRANNQGYMMINSLNQEAANQIRDKIKEISLFVEQFQGADTRELAVRIKEVQDLARQNMDISKLDEIKVKMQNLLSTTIKSIEVCKPASGQSSIIAAISISI